MRIIAGQAKGRLLKTPKGKGIRPALDKVKGAVFNILQHGIGLEGSSVLDLYAGTGNIGIEALSRGAAQATFVDDSKEAIDLIGENLKRTGFEGKGDVVVLRLPWGLKRWKGKRDYDLIFVDPPYDKELVMPTLELLAREKILAPSGRIVVEHSPREKITVGAGFPRPGVETTPLQIIDQRKYGQTIITFLTYVQE
ncbi:MAG: 16S rRNA (guanine(966)-N(2))-methyltransferase RsmD [bacterium]|nr:16S rRNA (guanine(966)-N(2))-methyltransferase RsmD [bacterium]